MLAVLLPALSVQSQQIENYDTGVYTDIFAPSPAPAFALVSGAGLNSSRGIEPYNIQYSLNYLQHGPFDLSHSNATLQFSTFFRITQPTQTGLGFDTLQIGFAEDQTVTSFIDAGNSGAVSFWLYPNSTLLTGGGYVFEDFMDVEISNGSTSAGFSWGTADAFILKAGEWYKATLTIGNVNSTTLSLGDEIDDYGTTGQQFISVIDTNFVASATGSTQFPFTPLTTDPTMFPALDGMSSGGLAVIDNTTMTGTLSPAIASSVQLDVQLSFSTQAGHTYYIESSPDLVQWKVFESVAGTGSTVNKYYSCTIRSNSISGWSRNKSFPSHLATVKTELKGLRFRALSGRGRSLANGFASSQTPTHCHRIQKRPNRDLPTAANPARASIGPGRSGWILTARQVRSL